MEKRETDFFGILRGLQYSQKYVFLKTDGMVFLQ